MEYCLKRVNTIRKKEIKAANRVLKSGVLSGFNAGYGSSFYGGVEVQSFEEKIKKYFNVRDAVTVNSWTSGLIIAVGALDLPKGSEVICSSWGMSATVATIIHNDLIPVFADIDLNTFSVSVDTILSKITNKTSAIMITEMYGYPSDILPILDLADRYGLKTISDTAQTIGGKYRGRFAGTLTDIGGFSFNWNKHIHSGEGGVVITNNKNYGDHMKLLRNHGEGAYLKVSPFFDQVGYNFRMNEIEAAMLSTSLGRLKKEIIRRTKLVNKIKAKLDKSICYIPEPLKGTKAVWCHCPIIYHDPKLRNKIFTQLFNNNYPVNTTFSRGPLHLLPIFSKYDSDNLVVTESLDKTLLDFDPSFSYTKKEIKNLIKILNNTDG